MFTERDLSSDLEAVRAAHAPDCLVLDVARDFETLPPAVAESLGLVVDELHPASHPDEWLPADAPEALVRYAGSEFTVGMPGDGTVTWTRQTVPVVVLVKRRAAGTPTDFLEFLLAESLVRAGLDVPEHCLPFFGSRYRELDDAVPLGPGAVYQLAVALYEAWVGRLARPIFRDWADERPRLYANWTDAGERLTARLDDLSSEVAHGETTLPEAAEFACSALKHGLEIPAPFAALDTDLYREHGPDYAVRWAERTFEQLDAD